MRQENIPRTEKYLPLAVLEVKTQITFLEPTLCME
jgi:hypothetical protein